MSRRESQAANRAAVLAAARELFEELGYHGATLDAIAARAGFSKGAVYSRFASKDDLFLAVLEDNVARRDAEMRQRLDGADEGAVLQLARSAAADSVQSLAWQAALIEFRVHAWRHPAVNERYAELHRRTIANLTTMMQRAVGERPDAAGPTIEDALHAFATNNGLLLELMADPSIDVAEMSQAQVRLVASGRGGGR